MSRRNPREKVLGLSRRISNSALAALTGFLFDVDYIESRRIS